MLAKHNLDLIYFMFNAIALIEQITQQPRANQHAYRTSNHIRTDPSCSPLCLAAIASVAVQSHQLVLVRQSYISLVRL